MVIEQSLPGRLRQMQLAHCRAADDGRAREGRVLSARTREPSLEKPNIDERRLIRPGESGRRALDICSIFPYV
jgi:hypothetical protein